MIKLIANRFFYVKIINILRHEFNKEFTKSDIKEIMFGSDIIRVVLNNNDTKMIHYSNFSNIIL